MSHQCLHPSTPSSSLQHHFLHARSLTRPLFSYIRLPLSTPLPFFLAYFITHTMFTLISQHLNDNCLSFQQYEACVTSCSLAAQKMKNIHKPKNKCVGDIINLYYPIFNITSLTHGHLSSPYLYSNVTTIFIINSPLVQCVANIPSPSTT